MLLTWHLRRLRIRSSEAGRSLFRMRCIHVTYRRVHRLGPLLISHEILVVRCKLDGIGTAWCQLKFHEAAVGCAGLGLRLLRSRLYMGVVWLGCDSPSKKRWCGSPLRNRLIVPGRGVGDESRHSRAVGKLALYQGSCLRRRLPERETAGCALSAIQSTLTAVFMRQRLISRGIWSSTLCCVV